MKKHLSFSQIQMFLRCPLSWKRVYIDGIKSPSNKWAQAGSIVHRWLATGELSVRENEDPEAYLMAKDIAARFDLEQFNPSQYTEKEMYVNYPISKTYDFIGYVDALNVMGSRIEFVDWKTNYTQNADPLQLAIYALLLSKHYPWVDEFIGSFVYIRLNKKDTVHFNQADLVAIEEWLVEQAKKIEEAVKTMEFSANPGAHCAYCPMLEQCSKSLDIVGQYKLTKLRLKQLTDVIKETVKDEPIVTPSGMATFSQSTRVSFSKKIADLDWVPKTVDKDAIKKDKELYEKLKSEGYIKESVYSSLKIE